MGTKNAPGRFDCYNAADPDEPIFTLRASDPDAPMLVRFWAQWREQQGNTNPDKIAEARKCADDMEAWRFNRA